MANFRFGHSQATSERGNERGNCSDRQMTKPPGWAAYAIVIVALFYGCGGRMR
jgi:hypothetical protein